VTRSALPRHWTARGWNRGPAATARRSHTTRCTWTRRRASGLSFYLYNTPEEVDLAVDAVAAIANRMPAGV
jgi:selenocysteine lyase/cysteine desulfurase